MVNLITNELSVKKKALIEAVNAVTNTDNRGANDNWLKSLEDKANANEDAEAKAKVETLKFFDVILRSSILTNPIDDTQLGSLVSEIRGYQVSTERFLSELGGFTKTDQGLEEEAVKKRNQLFETLDRVQDWLLTKSGRTNPSKIDTCITQFLEGMQSGKELELTRQLFSDQSLNLKESDLHSLADAWGNVVSGFVKDAQDTNTDDTVNVGDPNTIASFFCIHNSLETLYGRLSTNVSLVN